MLKGHEERDPRSAHRVAGRCAGCRGPGRNALACHRTVRRRVHGRPQRFPRPAGAVRRPGEPDQPGAGEGERIDRTAQYGRAGHGRGSGPDGRRVRSAVRRGPAGTRAQADHDPGPFPGHARMVDRRGPSFRGPSPEPVRLQAICAYGLARCRGGGFTLPVDVDLRTRFPHRLDAHGRHPPGVDTPG